LQALQQFLDAPGLVHLAFAASVQDEVKRRAVIARVYAVADVLPSLCTGTGSPFAFWAWPFVTLR